MGARTFLEVGPDARLTGLVRSILEGRDHAAIAVDASRGSAGNVVDLACALATLAALGYAVDLTRWDDGQTARKAPARKPGLTVRLSARIRVRRAPDRASAVAERVGRAGVVPITGRGRRLSTRAVLGMGCPGIDDTGPHSSHEITPRTIER